MILDKPDRIRCLLIENEWVGTNRTGVFSNLEKLCIVSSDWDASLPLSLDMLLFPRLRHLDIGDWNEFNKAIDFSHVRVPKLRYLSVRTDSESHWYGLIQFNSGTLNTLKISPAQRSGTGYSIARGSSDLLLMIPQKEILQHIQ